MKSKNILLIAENLPPRVGGIERYLSGLVGELAKNHHITIIAPKLSGNTEPIEIPNTTIIRRKFFWPIIRPAWLPLYFFIHRLAQQEKFDVVLCGKGLFEGLIGYYLKKRLNIPYIVFSYYMEITAWQKKPTTSRKLARVLQSADTVVVITEKVRSIIESIGVLSKNITTIYPGLNEDFFAGVLGKQRSDVLDKYGVTKPFMLSVGRLIERKGFDDLIRAYAKLDQTKFADVDLVIVGAGPERENLEKVAAQEYVKPYFLDNVPDEDLLALYANANLFALTPKEIDGDIEGFGIVYLEAGAASLPVIGTNTGGVPEAVENTETGLLASPGNVDDIAACITRLLQDPGLAQRLGAAGKRRAQDMFTWKQQAQLLHREIQQDDSSHS